MIRFEWYQRGNWLAPFGDDNLLFQTNLSDPFASIEVQITNGDFLHVHNVHIESSLCQEVRAFCSKTTTMPSRTGRQPVGWFLWLFVIFSG